MSNKIIFKNEEPIYLIFLLLHGFMQILKNNFKSVIKAPYNFTLADCCKGLSYLSFSVSLIQLDPCLRNLFQQSSLQHSKNQLYWCYFWTIRRYKYICSVKPQKPERLFTYWNITIIICCTSTTSFCITSIWKMNPCSLNKISVHKTTHLWFFNMS